jgi:sulfoxide reductase catalytic subunit YedY
MIRKPSTKVVPSEITPQDVFMNRRQALAAMAATGAIGVSGLARAEDAAPAGEKLPATRNAQYSVTEAPNSYGDITGYNNFYEFGTDKSDPKANSQRFQTKPCSVTIDGEAEVKGTFTLEDIMKPHALQERVYRFRCVEAWSMVVPWVGFPLADLIKRFKPTSKARYVKFTTLMDPRQMPGERAPILNWPYVEGLRMDEAMHPLTLLAFGMYGEVLPNQNGAPVRMVLPWKYGFKSGKSIVKIRFTDKEPNTAWMVAGPSEYGFYANVNPAVDHPRWSQASERRIGGGLFAKRVATLPFNGYADQVAGLYKGMDLRRFF